MKKIIILFFTTLCVSSFAQTAFPTDNAIWNEEYRISPYGFHQYGIKGDTTINDLLYQKLYILSDTTLECINEQSLPYGFIRNVEQKVYFKPYYWDYPEIDILLYDFGASVGDKIVHGGIMDHTSFYLDEDRYSIIQKIEIENNKKVFYLDKSLGLNDVWYEGTGSYRGLFGTIDNYIPLYESFPNKLVCFKNNDIVEFLDNPQCNRCFCTPDNIDEIRMEIINIIPNPTTGELRVVSSEYRVVSIEIFDIYGRMQEIPRFARNDGGNSPPFMEGWQPQADGVVINIAHLQAGLYFVKIVTEQGEVVKKVVKQ
ncbi:MAG: T9SS type A sorting domain-containing protein [Bacteroidales bacterium]|jgi:hypothetical protein|nr:T9SS type A sorting domain-containing protein [Bacteroidales bacterium]